MSYAESPVLTDAEEIKQLVRALSEQLAATNERLDKVIAAANGTGANVQWIVDNVSGIFQMFSNPAIVNQMMSGMMSGMPGMGGTADGGQEP